jgi:hypothetical protein
MRNANDTIENRTRNLLACSALRHSVPRCSHVTLVYIIQIYALFMYYMELKSNFANFKTMGVRDVSTSTVQSARYVI